MSAYLSWELPPVYVTRGQLFQVAATRLPASDGGLLSRGARSDAELAPALHLRSDAAFTRGGRSSAT
eukprot:3025081-Pyramimonas_sp.AAC.1